MNPLIAFDIVQLLQDVLDGLFSSRSPFGLLGSAFGPLLVCLLPVLGLAWFVYYLLSLPLRREERARVFLDLVETGLKRGQSVERTIIGAAGAGDPVLGAPFQKLASILMSGRRLDEALGDVPNLVPPPVAAALKIGAEIGDLGRVLPVCRRQLQNGYSINRSGLNYVVVMVFLILPVFPVLFHMVQIWVLPKFVYIYMDMMPGTPIPMAGLIRLSSGIVFAYAVAVILLQLSVVAYLGGSGLSRLVSRLIYPFADALSLRLPWCRKRIERNFSMMLATLLDGGVPEDRALRLAGESTANRVVQQRVEAATAGLRAGLTLPEALISLDPSREFQWRLSNALRSRQGFLTALSGWIDALDASALQQEQTAAHLFRTGLVLMNGLMVAFVAVIVFKILTTLIIEGTLW